MSAMEQMARNLLASMIPPEIMAMMTEENVIKAKAVMITFIEQQTTMAKNVEEILEHVRRDNTSGGTRKRTRSSGPPGNEPDPGSDN